MRHLLSCLVALCIVAALPAPLAADVPAATFTSQSEPALPTLDEQAAVPVAEVEPPPASTAAEVPAADVAGEEAGDEQASFSTYDLMYMINNLWIMIAAMLVFIMHLGFSTLESGLTQSKNTTNILFKNMMIICIGILTYAAVGFSLMYPGDDFTGSFFGFAGFGVGPAEGEMIVEDGGVPIYSYWTDFFFQAMFAATAATIISGCVAERIKLGSFLVFATIIVAFLYPWLGMWHWGEGWLIAQEDGGMMAVGFVDYAGSTLVHSVGGWCGLAAILVLGARRGKYVDGQIRPILPSNLPLAAIGVFLLWFGWFGFNGGSALSADPAEVSLVLVQTSIAAALGGFTGAIVSWIFAGKPDLTMGLNGILAGLVGITAAPDTTMLMTVITGISSGAIVYFAVLSFDKLRIDDPVGALSVHLVCGVWGTLLAAFHPDGSLVTQVIGIIAYGAVSFSFAYVVALGIKAVMGFRVSSEVELEGLDVHEHGVSAYHAIEAA